MHLLHAEERSDSSGAHLQVIARHIQDVVLGKIEPALARYYDIAQFPQQPIQLRRVSCRDAIVKRKRKPRPDIAQQKRIVPMTLH